MMKAEKSVFHREEAKTYWGSGGVVDYSHGLNEVPKLFKGISKEKLVIYMHFWKN